MYNGLNSTMDCQIPFFQVSDAFYEGDEILSPRRFVSRIRCVLLKLYSNSPYKFVVELPV